MVERFTKRLERKIACGKETMITLFQRIVMPALVIVLLQTGCATAKPAAKESARATYTNPVIADDVPDPTVKKFGSHYYCFGTTGNRRAPDDRIFSTWRSDDLVHWEQLPGALTPPSSNTNYLYWAPEVTENKGIYYLYYAMGGVEPEHFGIRVALSDHPQGPYFDSGVVLKDCQTNRFTIDPFPFRDDDGQWYLFYARDFLNTDDGARAGTALVVDRMIDMTTLAGEPRTVLRARHDWQRFQAERPMYGGTLWDWHTLEGPCVRKHEGRYYCFYSGGRWETESYGVDYAVADHPLGPYQDTSDSGGARVLRSAPDHLLGPGHNSLVVGPDGETEYLAYHAWDPGRVARRMCLDRLLWTPEGPRCAGPTWIEQEVTAHVSPQAHL